MLAILANMVGTPNKQKHSSAQRENFFHAAEILASQQLKQPALRTVSVTRKLEADQIIPSRQIQAIVATGDDGDVLLAID